MKKLTPISSLEAAKTFLSFGADFSMSGRKLQKLIYLAHENYVELNKEPLINNDIIEAQASGPVFRELSSFISNSTSSVSKTDIPSSVKNVDDKDTVKYLKEVYDLFLDKNGNELSKITHLKGSAWDCARNKIKPRGFLAWMADIKSNETSVITPELIKACA